MDTRVKIVSRDHAESNGRTGNARWISGDFDPLVADHVRKLREDSTADEILIIEITNPERPLLPQRARAELVAALEQVQYVVMRDGIEADAPDAGLRRDLIGRVRARCGGVKA